MLYEILSYVENQALKTVVTEHVVNNLTFYDSNLSKKKKKRYHTLLPGYPKW